MTDAKTHTEDWKALPWKKYQREVYRLQKRIYRASWVPMTKAHTLKSCLMGNYHGQFGSGGGAGDCPTDHNVTPQQTIWKLGLAPSATSGLAYDYLMCPKILNYPKDPKSYTIPLAFYNIRLYNFNMSQSSNLFRLQQIDSPIDQAHARMHEIETVLNNNSVLNQTQEYVKSSEQSLQDAQKTLRKTEDVVQDQHVKINQAESVLYGGKVRNPKELQDLQNDVAALKRFLSVLEDRQLEAMLALEDAEREHKQAVAKLDEVHAQITEQQAGLRGELTQLQKTVERLAIERQVAASAINAADLTLYEHLRQARRGVAVAKVSSQACGACGSLLTPALVQSANSPNQLIRCTSCGRILYVG